MISFSRVNASIIEAKRRIIKVFQFGAKTADQVSSFGDDSAPLPKMVAIYAETSETGESVIIGYINENQIAEPGEKRIFSLKSDGSASCEFYLKGDETANLKAKTTIIESDKIELSKGSVMSAIKYEALNTQLLSQNVLITAELSKIATVLNTLLPGAYVLSPIIVDYSSSKSQKVTLD